MALFQPSWIVPDARNGLGQGTVDATRNLTVSWRVNGASPMVSFAITIYQNNAASTQTYTTGRLTDGCPFYGTTGKGETRFFSYTIPAAALSDAGIANGGEYKLVITQWWSETDSVTQSSASVFITRAAPTLTMPEIGTIGTRYYTFTASYAQEQGDVLNWLRWQLAYAGDTANPIYDTQEISGTMELSAYYDGLFTGTDYAVRLTVQTENGVEATTGWVPFSVYYDTIPVTGAVSAKCASGTNAVDVDFTGIVYIPGTATGDYAIEGGVLDLPAGSSVLWNEVNYFPMSFTPPWTVLWKGTLTKQSGVLFTMGQAGGDLMLSYLYPANTLMLTKGETVVATMEGIINTPTVTVILTSTTLYIRSEYIGGGLYLSEELYPSATLYLRADDTAMVDSSQVAVAYTQEKIVSVALAGPAAVDYFEIAKGVASAETIAEAWTNGTYQPGLNAGDYFMIDFSDGLNAGNLNAGDETIVGYALYRRTGGENFLVHIADTGPTVQDLYDYGAASQQGPYTYYLFPVGETSYLAQPVLSNPITPCFWDWSVMECVATEDANIFSVLAEYRFGKNLTSGEMSNNNRPSVQDNFTAYPTVQRAPQNYKSGTLTSLIGYIDRTDGRARYTDTIALRDKLYALSLSKNALFLKSRKGDFLRIQIADAISMQTGDNTREQTQTITLPWVEVADAQRVSLVADANMAQ